VLNKIGGSDSSKFNGQIRTDGKATTLIFVNPSGITLGPDYSNLDTDSGDKIPYLMFSTANITESDVSNWTWQNNATFGLTLGGDASSGNIVINKNSAIVGNSQVINIVTDNGDVIVDVEGTDKLGANTLNITTDTGNVKGSVGESSDGANDGRALIAADKNINIVSTNGGNIAIDTSNSSPINITTSGDITINQNTGNLQIDKLEGKNITISAKGDIVDYSDGAIDINASQTLTITNYDDDTDVGADGNEISISANAITITKDSSTSDKIEDVYIALDGSINLESVDIAGDLTIKDTSEVTAGTITQTGTISSSKSSSVKLDFSGVDVADFTINDTLPNGFEIKAKSLNIDTDGITSPGDTVIITATGEITSDDNTSDITASTLTINASGQNINNIQTSVDTLNLT
jgi:hypothetical protein